MAKLIKEFENGLEKRTLVFRGIEFTYTMQPTEIGTEGDAPCFTSQLETEFPELSEDLLERVDMLDTETDADLIFEMLELLDEIEISDNEEVL